MTFLLRKTFLLLAVGIISVTAQLPETPVFPDVFSTEVEVVVMDEDEESDVSLYFDRTRNIAAVHFLSQKEFTISIYDFRNDRLLTITDKIICTVDKIYQNNSMFFPYEEDKATGKKKLLSAKELFRFPDPAPHYKSTEDGVPLHIYTAKMDLPFYQRKDCTVKYMFTKKSFTTANCDFEHCNSTLMGISIDCPDEGDDDELSAISQLFTFFRFKNFISDDVVFQVPRGVHCPLPETKPFPQLPKSFRFYYDVNEVALDVTDETKRSRINEKSVTFIENEVFAVDNFRNDKLIMRKVYDIIHGIGYIIDPASDKCTLEPSIDHFNVKDVSQLPNLLLKRETKKDEKTVYIGKRSSNGILYDVWTSNETKDSYHTVRDLYYLQMLTTESDTSPQLSHILEYTYEKSSGSSAYQLLQITRTSAYRFSYTHEWQSFDLSPCYKLNEKKEFEIQFPASNTSLLLPGSPFYKMFVVALSKRLIEIAGISTTRLAEIKIVGSKPLTLRGAILEDPIKLGWSKVSKLKEKNLAEAFNIVKWQVNTGNFTFTVEQGRKATPSTFKVEVFRKPLLQVDDSDDEVTYTKGAMAGLGVATLFIGLIIGGILILTYLKKARI